MRTRAGLIVAIVLFVMPAASALAANEDIKSENYRPRWKMGQRWIVETVCLQSQARRAPMPEADKQPVRWQFEVRAIDKIDGRRCFKVEVKNLVSDERSVTTLWVDEQAMTLRRVQTQLPVAGGVSTVTENYRSASGQPFPAFAPLTVPPLELPLFLTGAKGSQSFTYEASSTPENEKRVGDIDFSYSVDQEIAQPETAKIKDLLPQEYSKDLGQKPLIEVRLKAASSQSRQLWQPGLPWPVYSNNGVAESRLVEVIEPGKPSREIKKQSHP